MDKVTADKVKILINEPIDGISPSQNKSVQGVVKAQSENKQVNPEKQGETSTMTFIADLNKMKPLIVNP